jgi:hypothetical protein
MANTYTLIASNTLGASAASVTFLSIPATFTDLVLRASMRGSSSARSIKVTFNANASNYSDTAVRGSGTAASSVRDTSVTYVTAYDSISRDNFTADTFGSLEIYVPSYVSAAAKPFSSFGVNENNATDANIAATAGLWNDTSAITSIELAPIAGNFVSGSSFYLYGIKNS